MRKNWYIYCIFIWIFNCCHSKETTHSDLPNLKIDLDNLPSISFQDLFSEIELIPLETTDSTLLGIIYPFFTGSHYFMRDNTQQQLVAFDTNGIFLFKLANQGNGHKQYNYMSEAVYNPFSYELILVELPHIIHKYDSMGHFIEKKKTNFSHIKNIIPLNRDTLLVSNGYDFTEQDIYSYNTNRILKHLNDSTYYTGVRNFYNYNQQLFHFKWYNNIIYKVNEQDIKPYYFLDFGKYNYTDNTSATIFKQLYKYRHDEDKSTEILTQNFSFMITSIQENSKYIFLNIKNIRMDFKSLYIVYHKEKEKAFLFDFSKEGIVWDNWNDQLFEDCYITHIDASQKEYIDYDLLSPKNQSIYQNIEENDNPIIIKYKFK